MKNQRTFYRIFQVIDGLLCGSRQFATLGKAKRDMANGPWNPRRGARIYRVKIENIHSRNVAPNWVLPEGEELSATGKIEPTNTQVYPELFQMENHIGWKSQKYWSKESALLAFAGNKSRKLTLRRIVTDRVE